MQEGNVPGHRPSVWVKAPDGAQVFLVEGDPERFFVPPYVGGYGWVGIWLDGPRIDWVMVGELIEQSHRCIAAGTRSAGRRKAGKRRAKK